MIKIFGENEGNEGQEYEAACRLRDNILELWPDMESRPKDRIVIAVGLQCYGQKYQDIDLFVVGDLYTSRKFNILKDFQSDKSGKSALIKSFAWVIEVKSHDASGVRFNEQNVEVRYNGEYFNVARKNRKQKHCVKNYIERKRNGGRARAPYLNNYIWFTNLNEADLPPRPHPMFGSDCSFERLLNIHIQTNPNRFFREDPFKESHHADFENFVKKSYSN